MKPRKIISEIAHIFKEIQERPGQWFEMIRLDIKEVVGKYLTAMK
jgi:putative transposase